MESINLIEEKTLAYLAGFIDGEGCFQLLQKPPHGKMKMFSWFPSLWIANSNLANLQYIQSFTRGSIHNNKRGYNLIVGSNNLRYILPQITPYLVGKKEEAKSLLEALKLIEHRNKKVRDKTLDDKLLIIRKSLMQNHGSKKES